MKQKNSGCVPLHAVIWAMDPFQMDTTPNWDSVRELTRWVKAGKLALQPVHILSMPRPEGSRHVGLHHYVPAAQKLTDQSVHALGMSRALPAVVITEKSSSTADAVRKILCLSGEVDSPLIVVSSHGRSGIGRLMFGSFSEKLLLTSRHPVLFLNHSEVSASVSPTSRVLFPTDFSTFSFRAFVRFLRDLTSKDSEVIVLHAISLYAMVATDYGATGAFSVPENYFSEQERLANDEGVKWKQAAQALGVPVRFVIADSGYSCNVAECIFDIAEREQVSLIAMASVSGELKSIVAGSVARDVIRKQMYPVWVCGPTLLQEDTQSSKRVSQA
ncbi:MAG: universal stress protein [Methylotenera sp.]|nr:universal stress protein [Oligoflexia bacterium]